MAAQFGDQYIAEISINIYSARHLDQCYLHRKTFRLFSFPAMADLN